MKLFDKIFKNEKNVKTERVELTGFNPKFTSWSGNAYASDIFREGVDAIARNTGKLKASHVINFRDHSRSEGACRLNNLLQVEPNPLMSAYDFLYKMTTHYYLYNNAFAYIERDDRDNVVAIYPVLVNQADFYVDPSGRMLIKLYLKNGSSYVLPYRDVIHVRRFFNESDLIGDNNDAIIPALELSHAQNEGIINGIRAGVTIRGILKFEQLLSPEKLREQKNYFMEDYFSIQNSGGVVAVDKQSSFEPIDSRPVTIDATQLQEIKKKIFDYLGISDKIVNSTYSDEEWSAFYESTIEPFALAMSLEFTRKIFSERERAFGNEIIFESGRLQFKSNATKISMLKELLPMGLFTMNQALEILNLPSVPDGDRYIQSLNYIDQAIASTYQLGSATKPKEKEKEGDEE